VEIKMSALGQTETSGRVRAWSVPPPNNRHDATASACRFRAMKRLMHRTKFWRCQPVNWKAYYLWLVRGNTILNSVKSPGSVSTSMLPPCCFTMMSWLIDRPSPVPSPEIARNDPSCLSDDKKRPPRNDHHTHAVVFNLRNSMMDGCCGLIEPVGGLLQCGFFGPDEQKMARHGYFRVRATILADED